MRKCMMNAISMGCIAVGSFLMGGALGLALSKDESDIFEENCIKLKDYEYNANEIKHILDFYDDKMLDENLSEELRAEAKDSYDRMTKELYGPSDREVVMKLKYEIQEDTFDPYPEDLEEFDEEDFYDYSDDDEAEDESVETTTIKPVVEAYDREGNRHIFPVEDGVALKHTSEGLEEVTEPYIISEDDYWDPNQYPEFAQENLVYYAKDDVLTTERDEVIVDVDDIIGPNALTSFGSMCLDNDTVFVRNIRLGMEYEITRDEGSYQEVVLGYSDEEEEQAYKKAKQYFKNLEKEEEGVTT